MGSYDDRRRAEQWVGELEQLAGSSAASGASIDARLTAFAAAANAETRLLLADTIDQAVRTLRDDVIPQLRGMFGER